MENYETNYVWTIENTSYYPLFSTILPDGKLKVSTAGRDDNGLWDGYEIILADHSYYGTWRQIIDNIESILTELRNKEKERRSQKRKQKRASINKNLE